MSIRAELLMTDGRSLKLVGVPAPAPATSGEVAVRLAYPLHAAPGVVVKVTIHGLHGFTARGVINPVAVGPGDVLTVMVGEGGISLPGERTTVMNSEMTEDAFRSMLAEGFHTAFRKATDHPLAMPIHRLIDQLPSEEWGAVVRFVAGPLWEAVSKAHAAPASSVPALSYVINRVPGVQLDGVFISLELLEELGERTQNSEVTGQEPFLVSLEVARTLEGRGLAVRQARGGIYAGPELPAFLAALRGGNVKSLADILAGPLS